MESLTRRPVRRKESASNGVKKPYEDMGFSNWDRGKGKVFEVRDYAEIFSGSSSIPVFDISSLDDLASSGEYTAIKVDYDDVFGGLRNHNFAVPYEELFNGSMKESNPRIPASKSYYSPDSGHRVSPMNGNRVSGKAPDESPDHEKEHFNMPFSLNASDEKKEPAYAADDRPQVSPNHDFSRAWSFAGQVKNLNNRSRINSGRLHDSGELNGELQALHGLQGSSLNVSESNGKVLNPTDVPLPASKGNAALSSPVIVLDGFDETSPAAISANALKKAVDDARERITLAKVMMERMKKGTTDGIKHRRKRQSNHRDTGLDKCKSVNKDEDTGLIFTPSASFIDMIISAGEGKAEKNVETKKHVKNVEENEIRTESKQLAGPKNVDECTTVNAVSGNIDNDYRFSPFRTVLASCSERPENQNENSVSTYYPKEPAVIVQKEAARMFKKKMEVDQKDQQTFPNTNQVNDSGNVYELVNDSCNKSIEISKKLHDETGENLRLSVKHAVLNHAEGQNEEKFCNTVNKVSNDEEIKEELNGKGMEKPAPSQVPETKLNDSLNDQEEKKLEKKILYDQSIPLKVAEFIKVDDLKETETTCKNHTDGGDENDSELFKTFDQSEEEIMSCVVEAATARVHDSSDARIDSVVKDAAATSCIVDEAEMNCHYNSAFSQAEYEEEFEVRSNTGRHSSSPEADKCMEYKTEQASESGNHAENKVHSDSTLNFDFRKPDTLIGNADCDVNPQDSEDAFEMTTVIPDDFRESALNIPSSDVGIQVTDPHHVRNSQEKTSECRDSSPATSSKEYSDIFSGVESKDLKQGAASMKEELNDGFEMVEETTSVEGGSHVSSSQQLNSESDSKAPNETEKLDEVKDFIGDKDEKDVPSFFDSDQQQRIEAIRRGREREKDRLAVERAIREARERAKEKLERAAAEKQQASTEAQHRAERAAVERATAEARERALDRAKSFQTSTAARPLAEKVTSSSRNDPLKHSFSSSDLEGAATYMESAQRHKARLERHQRVMERAAKALEEKNKRDLLVQKEQAERNRVAEYLDADIKRWSAGKDGNLRALLSTLHYILGADSGWRPVSLTEIITTADVKKAYRKATLCVHPDKLQQRGASIQHKYTCEKVFDLLKAAWNTFISEER